MNRLFGALALAAALGMVAQASASTVAFSDTEGTAGLYTETHFSADDYVEYGFDYSLAGRLTADIGTPNPGDTPTGILVAANIVGAGLDAGLNLFPILPKSSYYTLEFDVFAGVNNGGGSTEFIMAGANTSGTEVNIDAGAIDARDGDWFEHSTEGGIGSDFITFTAVGGSQIAEDFIGNTSAPLTTALPSPPYPVQGAAGELWANYRVVSTPTVTEFYINGVFIESLVGSDYSSGLPMFGYSDIFSSVAGGDSPLVADGVSDFDPFNASFAIFDNIVVTVPEPSSLALFALSMVGLASRRSIR